MTLARSFPVLLLILAASPIGALAQSVDPANAVEAIEPGQYVRLDAVRMGRIEGRFLNADQGTLSLDRDGAPTEFQLGDIERLWVRGRSTGRGAWIGVAVGVAFGIWLGLEYAKSICHDDDGTFCTPAGRASTVGLVFGAGGAVVGAGIGFAIPTWRLRFP